MTERILTEAECQQKYLQWLIYRTNFGSILDATFEKFLPTLYEAITVNTNPWLDILKIKEAKGRERQ